MNEKTVIFFDGLCNLCNGAVQFTIQRDHRNLFHFASLQSDYAKLKLSPFNIDVEDGSSFVLLENGKVYERSTAALKVAKKLSGFWPLLYGFIIIPRFIRDFIYNFIAKNRYKWFGKKESCWVPTPALKDKFL
ncbi:Predicted thiol-disulfide oxidoreductase YuxK, DCC family [Pedobacter insulae]|uniref:Predicted thiol-disulfide oxidoreductase YuxK, DCC family n=2 Tax=Pedobacter insulae TaxID=414048 RepID=A0A1I2U827_9SPHI|nr:Predicted thiol-disulfide oxidoreductase YuxK, DCC family [Pedobacter insulae]